MSGIEIAAAALTIAGFTATQMPRIFRKIFRPEAYYRERSERHTASCSSCVMCRREQELELFYRRPSSASSSSYYSDYDSLPNYRSRYLTTMQEQQTTMIQQQTTTIQEQQTTIQRQNTTIQTLNADHIALHLDNNVERTIERAQFFEIVKSYQRLLLIASVIIAALCYMLGAKESENKALRMRLYEEGVWVPSPAQLLNVSALGVVLLVVVANVLMGLFSCL